MSDAASELGATNVRMTFRTFKAYKEKLRVIALAHDLRIGSELSLGAALNLIIQKYDDSAERAKVRVTAPRKKKGAKR